MLVVEEYMLSKDTMLVCFIIEKFIKDYHYFIIAKYFSCKFEKEIQIGVRSDKYLFINIFILNLSDYN
jgi:hypothetical protein